MRLPPKAVSTLCWIQSVGIVSAYLLACTFNKCYTKIVHDSFGDRLAAMPWIARTFVTFGPWLLAVPFIWAITAMTRADVEGGTAEITEQHTRIGYVITVTLALICFAGVWEAFRGAFVIPFLVN